MKKAILLTAPVLLLGACSQGGSGPDRIPAGRWETTGTLDTIDAPGMPDAQKEKMRQTMAQQMQAQSSAQCYRDDGGDQLKQMRDSLTAGMNTAASMNCEYGSDDRLSDGVMKITATCRPAGAPVSIVTTVNGTYTADSMNADMELIMEGTAPGGEQRRLRMTGKMTGRRVGDC
jgi:hypothetical protein